MLRLSAVALAVAGFLSAVPRVSADTVNLLLDAGTTGNGINGGGAFHWTQTTPVNSNYDTALTTYCIDLTGRIDRTGVSSYAATTDLTQAPAIGNDSVKVAAINTLFDHFYDTSLQNSTLQAGFQLALWELEYGSNSGLVSQRPTTPQVTADANGMLTGSLWNGTEHDLADGHLVALLSTGGVVAASAGRFHPFVVPQGPNQDQILVVQNPPAAVPAPPGLMLAAVGALLLIGRIRWTRSLA
jgi:hypothetical protein